METFLKSIGVADEVLEHLDQATLAFQRPAVLWIGLVITALILLIAFDQRNGGRYRYFCPFIQRYILTGR